MICTNQLAVGCAHATRSPAWCPWSLSLCVTCRVPGFSPPRFIRGAQRVDGNNCQNVERLGASWRVGVGPSARAGQVEGRGRNSQTLREKLQENQCPIR